MSDISPVALGQIIDPTTFGNPVVDELNALGAGCSLYRTTATSVPNTTNTTLPLDAEDYDTDGFHAPGTNPSRITIPAGFGGIYVVTYTVETATPGGASAVATWIQKNGVSGTRYAGDGANNSPSQTVPTKGSLLMSLIAGDYIEIGVFHSSGGALNFLPSANNRARFTCGLLAAQ